MPRWANGSGFPAANADETGMYTRCPDCQTAFRLSAAVLKKAQGRVRCGGCGSTFNALDHLSEERPADDPSTTQTARAFDERSRELLESLNGLAGGDEVRIEDTGVEWRVLDEDDDAEPDAAPAAVAEETSTQWTLIDGPDEAAANAAADDEPPRRRADDRPEPERPQEDQAELRFDDHTPLPDEFFEPSAQFPRDEDATELDEPAPEPDAGVAAAVEPAGEDDWEDLLAEVDFEETAAPADAGHVPEPDDAAPAAAPPEPGVAETARVGDPAEEEDTAAVDLAADTDARAGEESDGPPESDEPVASETTFAAADDADATEVEPAAGDAEPLASDEEPEPDAAAVPEQPLSEDDEIDRELMQAAAGGGIEVASEPDTMLVETIVMEGDSVTDLLEQAENELAAAGDDAEPELESPELEAAEKPPRPASSPAARRAMLAASVLLGALLAVQLVHANRATLATHPLIGNAVAPLYAALGAPVAPAWNIRGWRFESTDGSTDAAGERLTIHSRIVNGADSPLPYPLVHVSLTDRFDEVIGSRLLAPDEYLAGNASVTRPVPTGAGFTAVFTIDAPAPEATGYKLNVCYPLFGGRVRCAIENFRD